VKNLGNKEYKEIILNGCPTLAERFSQIDAGLVQKELKQAQRNQERITPEMKKVVKRTNLPERISALFFGHSKMRANCHLRS
jgi:hypothetical protein